MSSPFSFVLRRHLAQSLGMLQGNNNQQQPPDLDEIWREFNQKMNRLFGAKSNTPPQAPRPGQAGPGRSMPPIAIGVVAFIWLASGTFMVQEGQQAVVTRLGKLHHTIGPGIGWRLPWPIERAEIVDVTQLRSIEIGSHVQIGNTGLLDSSMLTRDENIVDMRLTVQYNLKNAPAFLFNNVSAETAVIKAAESAVREVVGSVEMDTVLNKDREAIQRSVMQSTQAQLDRYNAGVLVRNVNIQNVQPPAAVQAAFDDALKAGQDRDRLKNQGQAYANRVIAEAKGQAARMTEEAEGYKARILGQAEGDARRFNAIVAEYQKAPQVTRDRLYTDTMREFYAGSNKVFIDSKGNPIVNIPLEQLQGDSPTADRGGAAPAPATQAAAVAASTSNNANNSTSQPDSRSRDDARSRERSAR